MTSTVLSRQELADQVVQLRTRSKRIAATNGCFDLLHVGHLRFLQAARRLSDVLIVGVNSDSSVRALKGQGRPITPENERAEILAALRCVDYVSIFSETTAEEFLRTVKPDVYVKGSDYNIAELPERTVIQDLKIPVQFIDHVAGRSTTDLVSRIKESV